MGTAIAASSGAPPLGGARIAFDALPEWIERRREISAGAKLLFGRLLGYQRRLGSVFVGQARLAREIGLGSDRAVRRRLAELSEHGLIETLRRGYNRTLLYHVNEDHRWRQEYEAARGSRPSSPSQLAQRVITFPSATSAGPDRREAPPIHAQKPEFGSSNGSSSTRARAKLQEEEIEERRSLASRIVKLVSERAALDDRPPIISAENYCRALQRRPIESLRRDLAEQERLFAEARSRRTAAQPVPVDRAPRDPRENTHSAAARQPPASARQIEPGYEIAHARALAKECAHLDSADLRNLIVEYLSDRGVEPTAAAHYAERVMPHMPVAAGAQPQVPNANPDTSILAAEPQPVELERAPLPKSGQASLSRRPPWNRAFGVNPLI